jgi:cytochrome c oxidase subunit 2
MALLALFADGSPPENLSIFAPVSPPAESIRNLFWLVLAIIAVIAVVVEGVLLYNLWRFRQKPTTAPGEPPQVYGSMPIEIAWTTAPALVVVLLGLLLIRTELEVRADPPPPAVNDQALFVTVVGHQWWWEYRYDHWNGQALGFITANELHVPVSDDRVSRKIYLTLKSADTVHSYWLPRLAGKVDLIPNRINQLWFEPHERGLFLGQCGDFCGTQHANMLLRAYVDSPADFERWLANETKDAVQPTKDSKESQGRDKVFLGQSCVNCHTIKGTVAKGTVGPDLTHLMSRKTLLTGMVDNNAKELRRWVTDTQAVKPGCLMPAFKLPQGDVNLLVDYLVSLR